MAGFLSGFVAGISVADANYRFDKWDISEDDNSAEVTCMDGSGASRFIAGVYKAVIKASGPLDQGAMAVFVPGTDFTVTLTFTGMVTLDVPVHCKNVTLTADVKDAQRIAVEMWSTDTFVLGVP